MRTTMAIPVGTAVIAQEPLTDALWSELMPLLTRHYHEIATYRDIPLDPDRERYEVIQRAGGLRVFTARADGILVGYICFVVSRNLHYRSSVVASQDVIWLEQGLRGLAIGRDLMSHAEGVLRAEGVQIVTQHGKFAPGINIGAWLRRQGYVEQDIIYTKRLDL